MKERDLGWSVLLSCVVFSLARSSPVAPTETKQPFSIEEAALGQLSAVAYSGKWISDTEIEFLDKTTKEVKVRDVAKNQTSVVLKGSVLERLRTTRYQFSADRKFVLIAYDEKAVFRHSKRARYTVYSIEKGNYFNVTNEHLQVAEWSPRNSSLVFVKDNDMYVVPNMDAKMEAARITKDGRLGLVFNGIGDWVYEEEILSSGKAFWFSPNGDQVAFVTFFDTVVKQVSVPEYGEPGELKNQYVDKNDISYPKAGSPNPSYELRYVRLNKPQDVRVLTKYAPGREVFYDLKWISNDAVLFLQTNRVQNESAFYACEVKPGGACRSLFQEKNNKGWANTEFPIVSKGLDRILRIEGLPVGQNGKFKHLVMYKTNESSYPLTGGLFEVLKVVNWDEGKRTIYYTATEENSSTGSQLYAIEEAKGSKATCLTCQVTSPESRGCKDVSASFSKNSAYIILSCNGPDPKTVYLYKNARPLGKPLDVLEGNAKLRNELKRKLMPEVLNLTVEVPGPFKADVRLLLPPNMDRSGKTKYPLLVYVYGGPASKNINDAFKLDWGLYLSTNLSVIYGMIDGRNTLRKGENMLFAGYRALGTLEIKDQINVTRSLQKMFPFVDPSRTGIWGWSYGGYATTKVLETDRLNVFRCGVAVAPVADWIYYDSMYTERYMGTPQENKKGYETSSVLKDVSNLLTKKYFLIHGNADDNVHYQNAMMIAKALERNNVPFEMMSYPDEDHSLANVRKHLYYTMSGFWKRCFSLP